ncbi:hypothetical protein VTH06DRAFT_3450 [Thermothelomyces fergusii]
MKPLLRTMLSEYIVGKGSGVDLLLVRSA